MPNPESTSKLRKLYEDFAELPPLTVILFTVAIFLTCMLLYYYASFYQLNSMESGNLLQRFESEIASTELALKLKFCSESQMEVNAADTLKSPEFRRYMNRMAGRFQMEKFFRTEDHDSLFFYSIYGAVVETKIDTTLFPPMLSEMFETRPSEHAGKIIASLKCPPETTLTSSKLTVARRIKADIAFSLIALDLLFLFSGFYYPRLLRKTSYTYYHTAPSPGYFFEDEIGQLWDKADQLYNRSTYLLVGGIFIAFVGIVIFVISTSPDSMPLQFEKMIPGNSNTGKESTVPSITDYSMILRFIRSFGMLIFIESVAWYLLRQYRTLMEDFKSFNRLKAKKTNQLIAFKMLSDKDQIQPSLAVVIGDLLAEDYSGKLKPGESTEQLENSRIVDHNPIFDLLNKVVDRVKL